MSDTVSRDNAFSTILGEDYALLKFSYPHHDEFQQTVANQVHRHFQGEEVETIRVLEGGAGSGVTTSFLLAADDRIEVVAVDSAKAMLDQAATLLKDDLPRVELVESDLLAYVRQQPEASFEAFVQAWTLHNLQPDYREELFKEIARVLKPGGILVTGDKYQVDDVIEHENQLQMQLDRFRGFPTENSELISAWVEHNLQDEDIRMTEAGQLIALEEVGFVGVKVVYRQDMEAVIVGVKE